ncbi:MAG: ABC transporter ATP-binding protein [Cyanobacteria bacterium P01_G01_bin.39]
MLQLVKRLLYIIPASKKSLAWMVFLFMFSSALEVIGIGAIAPFINLAGKPELIHQQPILEQLFTLSRMTEASQFVAALGIVVMFMFCLKVVIAWLTQVFIFRFSCRQQRLLIDKLLDRYLAANYTYFLEKNSSYVVDNVIEVANKFTVIVQPLFVSGANICIAVSLFALLWYTSSTVMIILLTILLPVILIINSFKQRVQAWGRQNRLSKRQLIQTINHSLGGIKETKVIGCENYFKHQVSYHTKELEASQSSFFSFNILPRYLIEAVMLVSTVSVISYFLFIGNDINELHSVLGVYALASIRFLPAFSQAVGGINSLRNHSYTINQIYSDLQKLTREKVDQSQSSKLISRIQEKGGWHSTSKLKFQTEISIDNISYRYPNQSQYAVRDLSLNLKKGDSIAFIGKSGAGKTTLVDIILGLLTPQQGDIRVDNVSIYSNLRAWQNLVGYIPQSIFLADDTIKRNIAFGVPDELIDANKLKQAIESAQLSEVISKLPNGVDSRVGERGILLSGGQRQRVGIARALYHEREILVLDEATAALDYETEKLVTDAINALSGQKTLITIAHRLSTVEKCDRIYELHQGNIVNAGRYSEVTGFKK